MSALPRPSKCKRCRALISWVKTTLGRNIPLEPKPDPQGPWTVVQDVYLGQVACEYKPILHGGLPRYRSHFERCQPSGRTEPGRKADPTSGLKFPRRQERTRG